MKKIIFKLAISIISLAGMAQEPAYKIVGNEIVKTETAKVKTEPTRTGLTHTIKGVKYPVYQSAKGAYYILRVSKKTGKEYKQYLKIEK